MVYLHLSPSSHVFHFISYRLSSLFWNQWRGLMTLSKLMWERYWILAKVTKSLTLSLTHTLVAKWTRNWMPKGPEALVFLLISVSIYLKSNSGRFLRCFRCLTQCITSYQCSWYAHRRRRNCYPRAVLCMHWTRNSKNWSIYQAYGRSLSSSPHILTSFISIHTSITHCRVPNSYITLTSYPPLIIHVFVSSQQYQSNNAPFV